MQNYFLFSYKTRLKWVKLKSKWKIMKNWIKNDKNKNKFYSITTQLLFTLFTISATLAAFYTFSPAFSKSIKSSRRKIKLLKTTWLLQPLQLLRLLFRPARSWRLNPFVHIQTQSMQFCILTLPKFLEWWLTRGSPTAGHRTQISKKCRLQGEQVSFQK